MAALGMAGSLPELASVPWREPASQASLRREGRRWTLCTAAHTLPLIATAGVLAALNPITIPVGLILLAHAWAIPELYANRGAKVTRIRETRDPKAERRALGLLGDLLDHRARALHRVSGMAIERGSLGVWVLAPYGALLVRPGGHRVHCYCVGVADPELPPSDRTAHLLLALREDESGFATVANLAFAGAVWRVRRRLDGATRQALEEAVREARAIHQ